MALSFVIWIPAFAGMSGLGSRQSGAKSAIRE